MRLFEPAPGLVSVTGYNGRGNTTGTVVGKALAQFLLHGQADKLPLPFCADKPVSAPGLRTGVYETGFSSTTPARSCASFCNRQIHRTHRRRGNA